VGKALDAFGVLVAGNGAGNDFLGWKHLPSETPESLIADCEAIRDDWKAKGVDLVIAIGIGGSYLGAKCAIEALSQLREAALEEGCRRGGLRRKQPVRGISGRTDGPGR
jgi:glucose-6-phosphate isomerase